MNNEPSNSETFRIWGLEITPFFMGGKLAYNTKINGQFKKKDGRYYIGLSEKIFKVMRQQGVEQLFVKSGEKTYNFWLPSEKYLKAKVKNGECEYKKSKFANSKSMLIYHFAI